IDQALHRILKSRFLLGMFDPPDKVPYSKYTMADVDTPEHSTLALQAARESIVLLKNTDVLPLDKTKLMKIAVIGPNADSATMLSANYNGTPSKPVTILAGIRAALAGTNCEVTYSAGCPLVTGFTGPRGGRGAAPATDPQQTFDDAVALAKDADVVIYVGGISANLEGEEMTTNYDGFSGGDRTRIELPDIQTKMLKALKDTGKPVVFVNCSGSAMAMPWEAENIPAILQAWYPGENGGTAVADVVFGDYNPAGRLPVTFYKSTADLPAFDNYSMANRTYRYFTGKPLFAFGHGLSYTQFQYSKPELFVDTVDGDGTITLSIDIANTGDRDGDEVVQIYAHPQGNTDPLVPRQRLVAFQRVSISKGNHVVVPFSIPTKNLRLWDTVKKDYVVAAGAYEFQIGAASDDIRQTAIVKITAAK
ncbi:MAG TPA: glycoside hydrolase family 3 C-terminal domain-containing protein, partial [Opitutales bacterium]|nr:glycoside hydrolase family 3 C-terminal domain-containing protein [Opitutales bacterium]